MRFLFTILILVTIWTHGHANGDHTGPPGPAGPPGPQGPPGADGTDGIDAGGGAGTTSTETILVTEYNSEGTASAMAAGQCQFDWTHDLQGCVGGATFDGNDALAFQLGKRYKKVLINGGISYEAGEYGAAGAINWKFK